MLFWCRFFEGCFGGFFICSFFVFVCDFFSKPLFFFFFIILVSFSDLRFFLKVLGVKIKKQVNRYLFGIQNKNIIQKLFKQISF